LATAPLTKSDGSETIIAKGPARFLGDAKTVTNKWFQELIARANGRVYIARQIRPDFWPNPATPIKKMNRDGGHLSVCPFTETIGYNRLKRRLRMKRILLAVVAVSWLVGGAALLRAQDETTGPPPKVLVITREMVKVGKGAAHAKNEAAWVRAAMAAKEPDRYLAATTMAGPNEALFFAGFDTYAAFGGERWRLRIRRKDNGCDVQ
jgi:hypothetical protein